MKNYQDFTVNDFIDDERFRNYVLRKTPSDIAFWGKWLSENPLKKQEFEEAERFVQLLSSNLSPYLSEGTINGEWQKLSNRIDPISKESELHQPVLRPLRSNHYKWYWAVAASITVLLTTFLWFKYDIASKGSSPIATKIEKTNVAPEATIPTIADKAEVVVKTPYGKTRKISLPDGSVVLLNANSVLKYSQNWSKSSDRMVWLDGEAEFSVKHYDLPQGVAQKFIVKTKGVNVEVIGTRFNLMNRAEKCKLALYEGVVQLHLTKHPEQESIAIEPNEIAQIDNGAVVIISQIKKVEVYQAWTKQHFEFDNTPLSDVALLVENTYGLKFVFKEESLRSKRLTASIPDDDVEVLVKVISQIFNIKTQQNTNEVIFEKNN